MALHFTLVGKDELAVHFDLEGLGELLKGVEGAIRAARENAEPGPPDEVAIAAGGGPPGSVAKVTMTLLDPPRPTTH
ncbi:MAG TPA: hypothetical protein VF759_01970 [Allosphingosinicella sp.]|jgi:hypothetical protein